MDAFPCLRLAREAAAEGGTAPCVMNAANEIAVHAFLRGELSVHGHRPRDRVHARRAADPAGSPLLGPLSSPTPRRAAIARSVAA